VSSIDIPALQQKAAVLCYSEGIPKHGTTWPPSIRPGSEHPGRRNAPCSGHPQYSRGSSASSSFFCSYCFGCAALKPWRYCMPTCLSELIDESHSLSTSGVQMPLGKFRPRQKDSRLKDRTPLPRGSHAVLSCLIHAASRANAPRWGEGRSSPTTPIYAPKSLGKPPCRGSHHPSSVFH
jgi:hypothetical protein